MPITPEQCVALLREALANRPADHDSQEFIDWHADVVGTVQAWNPMYAPSLAGLLQTIGRMPGQLSIVASAQRETYCSQFMAETRALFTRLRLQTNVFQTAQVAAGAVYDYFEEVRQIIAGATREVLFTDPYLDASFVERYLPQIPAGVTVRLLTSQGKGVALAAACALYAQQHGASIEVRTVPNQTLHDRHVVIDGRDLYQSGASFKDGGRHAPTSINQIVDAAADLIRTLERTWANAQVVP
jgi:hypothetical protein